MREITLDTETTGLSPNDGHRVIEIGCVELFNKIPTGKVFHHYINPLRDVPKEATAITGLTEDFLKPFPIFENIVDDFLDFIRNDVLVIHNASFDLRFLNFEIKRLGKDPLKNEIIDTLKVARNKFPGSPASLDALSRRYKIQIAREKHGALLDAKILSKIFYNLFEKEQSTIDSLKKETNDESLKNHSFPRRHFTIDIEEKILHENWIKTFM